MYLDTFLHVATNVYASLYRLLYVLYRICFRHSTAVLRASQFRGILFEPVDSTCPLLL